MDILIFQHVACEGLGSAEEVLRKAGLKTETVRLYAGEEPPRDTGKARGAILLGGPMNVYQEKEYPCLAAENELLRQAIARDLPTLGVCLGAQLIAKAAGARVYAGKEKEIGWYPLRLSEAAQKKGLLAGLPSPSMVFQWHGDTFELPAGARSLASSDLFAQQAFRLKNNIYALQFHLETTPRMVLEWLEEYAEEARCVMGKAGMEEIRRHNGLYGEDLQEMARLVFKRFAEIVLRYPGIRAGES